VRQGVANVKSTPLVGGNPSHATMPNQALSFYGAWSIWG
jgi:hypothetical protein